MKKNLILVLAASLAITLFGCTDTPEPSSSNTISRQSTTASQQPTEKPAQTTNESSQPTETSAVNISYKTVNITQNWLVNLQDGTETKQTFDKSVSVQVPENWDGKGGLFSTYYYTDYPTLTFEGFDAVYEGAVMDQYILLSYYKDTRMDPDSEPLIVAHKDDIVTQGISQNGYAYVLYDENIIAPSTGITWYELFMQITDQYIIEARIGANSPSIIQTIIDSVEYK